MWLKCILIIHLDLKILDMATYERLLNQKIRNYVNNKFCRGGFDIGLFLKSKKLLKDGSSHEYSFVFLLKKQHNKPYMTLVNWLIFFAKKKNINQKAWFGMPDIIASRFVLSHAAWSKCRQNIRLPLSWHICMFKIHWLLRLLLESLK